MNVFRMALESIASMKLYHYSAVKHKVLKTRELTEQIKPGVQKEALEQKAFTKDPGTYNEHISFFFEPVPLDLVGKIFGKDHPFWYPGHEIYEHIVNIDDLPKFKYRIVETPVANKMFYATDWDKHVDMKVFYEKLYTLQKQHGEIGDNPNTFKSAVRSLVGTVRKAYEALPSQPNWDELKKKYAATVPHVMLYPEGGEVVVAEIHPVIVK